jgi:hypothetical protein
MKTLHLSKLFGLAALVALSACQSAPDTAPPAPAPTPIPAGPPASGSAVLESVTITPPDGKVPTKYAAFSGIWSGSWNGVSEGKLAVKTVSANGRVTVSYAWGTLADNKPGTVDGQGKIGGSTLKLDRFANGADATFTMQGDGTLAGTYALSGITYTGVFSRQ